jgi:uncharacterized protein YndB with AHSA1/START domain
MAVTSQSAKVTLPTDTLIKIEREFDAPAHLVFRAYTEPDLVRRWWTGGRGEMTVVEIDLRVGGRWRYAMETPDGSESAFHGEYREIVPDERLVSTAVFEGAPDAASLDTLTFEERDGRTLLTILVEHTRKEHRDAHVESGMEEGLQDALDLLGQVAAAL